MARVIVLLAVSLMACRGAMGQVDVPSPGKAAVWGRVTRSKRDKAEFSLNTSHGLWEGKKVSVYRPDDRGTARPIGSMQVVAVDDVQAVGIADGFFPAVGDQVLFQKPAPRDNPDCALNKLIGMTVDLTFQDKNGAEATFRGVVLDVEAATDQDIKGLDVAFPSIPRARYLGRYRYAYEASSIKSMRAGTTDYVFDPTSGTLVEQSLVASRAREAERQRLAVLAEQRAERERVAMQEAERAERERQMRLNAEVSRRRAEFEAARAHLVAGDRESAWKPAPGYSWVDPSDPNDLRVRWSPGIPHPGSANVVASADEGKWAPAAGYQFANDVPGDLTVVRTNPPRLAQVEQEATEPVKPPSGAASSVDWSTLVKLGFAAAALWAFSGSEARAPVGEHVCVHHASCGCRGYVHGGVAYGLCGCRHAYDPYHL